MPLQCSRGLFHSGVVHASGLPTPTRLQWSPSPYMREIGTMYVANWPKSGCLLEFIGYTGLPSGYGQKPKKPVKINANLPHCACFTCLPYTPPEIFAKKGLRFGSITVGSPLSRPHTFGTNTLQTVTRRVVLLLNFVLRTFRAGGKQEHGQELCFIFNLCQR